MVRSRSHLRCKYTLKMADDTVGIGNRTTACFLMAPSQPEFSDDSITRSLRRSMANNAAGCSNGVAERIVKATHRASRGCISMVAVGALALVTVTTNSGIPCVGCRMGHGG